MAILFLCEKSGDLKKKKKDLLQSVKTYIFTEEAKQKLHQFLGLCWPMGGVDKYHEPPIQSTPMEVNEAVGEVGVGFYNYCWPKLLFCFFQQKFKTKGQIYVHAIVRKIQCQVHSTIWVSIWRKLSNSKAQVYQVMAKQIHLGRARIQRNVSPLLQVKL